LPSPRQIDGRPTIDRSGRAKRRGSQAAARAIEEEQRRSVPPSSASAAEFAAGAAGRHGGRRRPRYVERDLLDPTPARLQPLDLSSGGGFLSSPDPADHHPWDRPLFRRVVVRPMERVASRFALASPRPLLIGLIAILAKVTACGRNGLRG
jgi:hypothetical protein